MKVAETADDLSRAWSTARAEARAAFGDDAVYLEKFLGKPRHIEIQILGDGRGNAVHLGERDCSLQRRHQKVWEEAPSPALNEAERASIGRTVADAMKELGYSGAGTVEFLYEDGQFYFIEMNTRIQVEHPVTEMITGFDLVAEQSRVAGAMAVNYRGAGTVEFLLDAHGAFYFMEMNTRIQVEHPVTEEVTGEDLIEWQLRVASGEKVTGGDRSPTGHSIECRINAEDPFRGFAPSPGRISAFHTPKGRGVRCDTHVFAGYTVPPTYDSMIAKLIVRDATRARAIEKMRRALDEFVVEGVRTTIPFHKQLLVDERFRAGDFDTKFLERFELQPEA
jgi:acetyl-CoA carboxylase biotin carboxylase subunit